MSKRKPGEWWDKSWSVVTGCTPAGAGCDHCWARSLVTRFPVAHATEPSMFGARDARVQFSDVVCHPERLDEPLRRRKPTIYAVSLLGDLFHEQVPTGFVQQVIDKARSAIGHRFVFLTKRPERVRHTWEWDRLPCANIIVMASAWDQPSTDAACAALSAVPGLRWGLHLEPLLSPVDLDLARDKCHPANPFPAWIVAGGENGPGARPCDPRWIRALRTISKCSGVPFWFKGPGSKVLLHGLGPSTSEADMIAGLEQTREVPW